MTNIFHVDKVMERVSQKLYKNMCPVWHIDKWRKNINGAIVIQWKHVHIKLKTS